MAEYSEWLTIKEIAGRMKVSPDTVYKYWRDLGGFKVGGVIRFDWERTRERLFAQPARNEKEMVLPVYERRSILSGRNGLSNTKGRQGRRSKTQAVFERIPDRYGLLAGMRGVS